MLENSNLFQFIKKNYVMMTGSYIDYVDKKKYNKKIPEAENITTKKINNSKFEKKKILLKNYLIKSMMKAKKCKSKIIYIRYCFIYTKKVHQKHEIT